MVAKLAAKDRDRSSVREKSPLGSPNKSIIGRMEMKEKLGWIDRRRLMQLLGAGAGALATGLPNRVFAQPRKNTLVLGIDISDTITLDPARLAQYTSPMTVSAAYDCLVTMKPGEYINVAPSLATKCARTPDGKGWRFTLLDGVKFPTGNLMT